MVSITLFVLLGFAFPGHSLPLRPQNSAPDAKPSTPSLYIFPPPAEELPSRETVSLRCLVESFYPWDFSVQWLQNGQPVSKSTYSTGQPNLQSMTPERYFLYSRLDISKEEWNSGDSFSCQLRHETLPFPVIQKTVKKNRSKPSPVDVSIILSDAKDILTPGPWKEE